MFRFMAICGNCWRDGALFAGRPTGPIADGGLGMLRVAMTGLLGARVVIAPGLEPIRIGGRGMERPAGEGATLATDGRPSGARPAVIELLRTAGFPGLRAADGIPAGREGGVKRLNVGRETTDGDGRDVAFGPSIASRVGVTFGLPMLATLRKAPGESLAAFAATGSPRCSVLCETAVNALGRLA